MKSVVLSTQRPRALRCLILAPVSLSLLPLAVLAEDSSGSQATRSIEEITVVGQQLAGPQFDVKSTETTFDLEAIESLQANNVFDIIRHLPGIELSGGPRANALSLNIRGFSDNEDVLIVVDGAVKNFEKYRFGSVMPEPELLRELTVSRGPASILQGSGAIGGVVEMATKNAADYLYREGAGSDDRLGGFIKLGYADNNREWLTLGTVYGKPTDSTDLLLNITQRDAENITLSTGDELAYSDASPEALLAKFEWSGELALLGLAYSSTSTSGLELFDTAAGSLESGVNGQVYRRSEDHTLASYFNINPDTNWLDVQANLAYTDTQVDEQAVGTNGQLLPRRWDYQYDIWSGRLHNNSSLQLGAQQTLTLQLGLQFLEEERHTRITDIQGNASDVVLSQPSGVSQNWGSYLQLVWEYSGLSLTTGYRWDHNRTEVLQAQTRELLINNQLDTTIKAREGLLNYRLNYQFNRLPLQIFHSYVETVRYPKLDEYFTQGQFSNCNPISSSADVLLAQLSASEHNTAQGIANNTLQADSDSQIFSLEQQAQRDRLILATNTALALYIEAAQQAHQDNPAVYTATQRDADIARAQASSTATIEQAILTTESNIQVYNQQIQQQLNNTNAALRSAHNDRLTAAGLSEDSDLSQLDYPTKTTLPEPYQSLGFCGALYQPELAQSREWGLSYDMQSLLNHDDQLQFKFTYYLTRVNHRFNSINTNPDNPTAQPGKEKSWGYELEAIYVIDGWRFDLAYNRNRGSLSGYFLVDNPDTSNAFDEQLRVYEWRDKQDMPADKISLGAQWISSNLQWQLGMKAHYRFSRYALEWDDGDTVSRKQDASVELEAFAKWEPNSDTRLQLTINNLTNTRYRTPGAISEEGELLLNNYNRGRNIKLALTRFF